MTNIANRVMCGSLPPKLRRRFGVRS